MDPRCRNWCMVAFAVVLPLVYGMGCSGDTARDDSGIECTQDEQCGIGEYCHNGVCTPFGGDDGPQICSADEECPDGQICEDGICTPGTRPDGGEDADGGTADDGQTTDAGDEDADQDLPFPKISLGGDVTIYEDEFGKTYEINFGNVAVGIPVTRTLIIRNLGTATLDVSVVTLQDDPLDEFSLDPAVPPELNIEPGEEVAILATYLAVDGMTDRARARIFSNDPSEGEIPVHLISEFKGEVAIHLDPNSLDYGDVPLGQVTTQSVNISNLGTGNAVLRLDSVVPGATIANAYEIVLIDPDDDSELTLPVYLNRDQCIRADISYLAHERGLHQGDIIIESTDEDASPSEIAVRGRAGTPMIVVSPERVLFGEVPTLIWSEKNVTVSNVGVGDLLISSVQPGAGDWTDLSLDPPTPADPPVTLAPDESLTFKVRFFPSVEYTLVDTDLVIEHDDPDQETIVLEIEGTAVQGNARPTAVIKANGLPDPFISVMLRDLVNLDGLDSSDADGTIVQYQWRIIDQPVNHPCGQESYLTVSGTQGEFATIILQEAGHTQIGLQVRDNDNAWSDEDVLDIEVGAKPEADIRVGNNTTGFIQIDMDQALVFDGAFSSDCDGFITAYQWSVVSFPPGRLSPPNISPSGNEATVVFDFPGDYTIGLTVRDNDAPTANISDPDTFVVRVIGPKGFRITLDWFDRGRSDHHVDVDFHMLKPGSTNFFSPDDCCPDKNGRDVECDRTPNWGAYGSPNYQRDSYEDGDAAEPPDPSSPADEISFLNPGMGDYPIYVYFRCHSSSVTPILQEYVCCDDAIPHCPIELWCQNETCLRRADGTVIVYVTDKNSVESEVARRNFSIDAEQFHIQFQIGTLSWPDGTFQ